MSNGFGDIRVGYGRVICWALALVALGCNPQDYSTSTNKRLAKIEDGRKGSDDAVVQPGSEAKANQVPGSNKTTSDLIAINGTEAPAFSLAIGRQKKLVRLTNTEFSNGLSQVFNERVKLDLVQDPTVDGYKNRSSFLKVSIPEFERYFFELESYLNKKLTPAFIDKILKCGKSEKECVETYLKRTAIIMWRFQSPAAVKPFVEKDFADWIALGKKKIGLKSMLMKIFLHPNALYRSETGDTSKVLTTQEILDAISMMILGQAAPKETLEETKELDLKNSEDRVTLAQKLLKLPEAKSRFFNFISGWLHLKSPEKIEKSATLFPNHQAKLKKMEADFRGFIDAQFESGNVKTLFSAEKVQGQAIGPKRKGILTLEYYLATHAKANENHPIERGKTIRERLLCQPVAPPPEDIPIEDPVVGENLTLRERHIQHAVNPTCAGCHALMDPLGFAFEGYDAMGQIREEDMGLPVDTTGTVSSFEASGVKNPSFADALELTTMLAQSEVVEKCFVKNYLSYLLGEGIGADDDKTIDFFHKKLKESEGKFKSIVLALVQLDSFIVKNGGDDEQ